MDLLKKNRKIIYAFIPLLCLLSTCKTVKNTSVENGSMRNTEGYPMITNKEKIKRTLENKCVDTIQFNKGEIIADIGAANGYLEAMLSLYNDSLTFYIQDIDTFYCNQNKINEVVDFYQKVNGKPFTNKFIAITGTDTKTNLPNNKFDKILMLWTYPYFKKPKGFIKDVRKKLKTQGLLYVINPFPEYEYGKSVFAKYGWNASPIEKQISDIIDCDFELIRISRNYNGPGRPYIMVFKKK